MTARDLAATVLTEEESALWTDRARRLLEDALSEIDDVDVIPTVSAAEACLRIAMNEMDAEEMDGYPFPGEDWEDLRDCICPPDLLARGGHKGECSVHG